TIRRLVSVSFALVAVAALVPAAMAGPAESKVGDVRVAYSKKGTTLRADAALTATPTATLAYGTRVQVLEVKLPWIRVQKEGGTETGWVKAYETVEPEALVPDQAPPHVTGAEASVSNRDVAAAGRQLDAATERSFRASRQDLA